MCVVCSGNRFGRQRYENVFLHSGRFAHHTDAYEYDFSVLRCDLRIIDSCFVVDMRHIDFHFFLLCDLFGVSPCLQEYNMI